jgi:hypothetical protein
MPMAQMSEAEIADAPHRDACVTAIGAHETELLVGPQL